MASSPLWAHAVAAGVVLLCAGGWLLSDLDFDGLPSYRELADGTRPWTGDTDGDRLGDGWERRNGLDPRSADADGDGLNDLVDVQRLLNPLSADSDGDGIPDGGEPTQDCDGDGRPAGAEGDDDNDARLDRLEPLDQRCKPDTDLDGVLDGSEGAASCVVRPDCDGDGLADGTEGPAGFDALDADTFKVGLSDSVSWAFAQRGQPAGRDDDADGIPDPWEGTDGAIAWGSLTPQAGRRDLLIEFIRVEGPQSGRFGLDLGPAYQLVADTFLAQANTHVGWVETRLSLASEQVPPIVPSISDPYYSNALSAGQYSGNPFVTTVVMNPQHDQSLVAHAGIAPIRGMIAAVDYGQFSVFSFADANGSSLSITPLIEALVLSGQNNTLIEAGYDALGFGPGSQINLHRADTQGNNGYTLRWTPRWYSSAIRVDFDMGSNTTLTLGTVNVQQQALASTILHELGHTLGLCHAHDPECDSLSTFDHQRHPLSTMSYDSGSGTLRFLPSEWTTALNYLTCPPVEPVTLLAESAPLQDLLDSKYVVDEQASVDDARACGSFLQVARQFEPGDPAAQQYDAPASFHRPEGGSSHVGLFGAVVVVALLAATGSDVWLWRRRRPTAPVPDVGPIETQASETAGDEAPDERQG